MNDCPAAPSQMAKLVGRWIGEGEIFPNPFGPAGPTKATWTFWMDAPGLHLIHDYRETRSDGSTFEGHGVFAVDPQEGQFVWFWFDTYGHPPLSPARGRWAGETLELQKTTPRGVGRTRFALHAGQLIYDVEFRPLTAETFMPVAHVVLERSLSC